MEYTRDIVLNLTPDGDIPVVRVKQGDSSTRFIRALMTWNGDDVPVGAELTALFRMRKPDGTGVLMDSDHIDTELGRYLVIINADGTVSVELTAQTMTCPGFSICDICLMRGEKVISTTVFVLSVLEAPDISSRVISTDDFRTLVNAIADVGKTSPVYISRMEDVELSNVVDGNILSYDAAAQKWINKDPDDYGYLKEPDARTIITGYQYQTEAQVNSLIEAYIDSLDANETEY